MSTIGIITARGGSKGLPRKNITELAGKPLIVHTIEAALRSRELDRCFVSTEDQEIKAVSLMAGAEVIDRPLKLAEDHTLSRDVVLHVLEKLASRGPLPEHFMLLQPTSPLRSSRHIDESIKAFLKKKAGSCVSVCLLRHSPYKSFKLVGQELLPITDWGDLEKPRQQLPHAYRANGAIYLTKCRDFLRDKTFFIKPVLPYVMGERESIDIDCLEDLVLCEKSMKEITY